MTPAPQPGPERLAVADVDRYQRRFCARRPGCLELAAANRWPSLSCIGCDAYAPLTGLALQIEVATLVHLHRHLESLGG